MRNLPGGGERRRAVRSAEFGVQPGGRRLSDFRPALQCLAGQSPNGARDAERADNHTGEIMNRDGHAAHFKVEFAVVDDGSVRLTSSISLSSAGICVNDFSVDGLRPTRWINRCNCSNVSAASKALPTAVQWAGRTTPTRSANRNALGPPVRAITTTASPKRTQNGCFADFPRQFLEHGRRKVYHIDFVKRACASTKSGRPMR